MVVRCHQREGVLLASASGVPPGGINDIGGAEAWALYQAAVRAVPGSCNHISDSLTTVEALHAGSAACGSGKKRYARVYKICCSVLEEARADHLIWMPAHKAESQVGQVKLTSGVRLTELDRQANDMTDCLAKVAVELHRIKVEEVKKWERACEETIRLAKWGGQGHA